MQDKRHKIKGIVKVITTHQTKIIYNILNGERYTMMVLISSDYRN